MIDIAFYLRVHATKMWIHGAGIPPEDKDTFCALLDEYRSQEPVVFNIESTNSCSMSCPFCPRTALMKRPVKTMDTATFMKVALQLKPHSPELWSDWVTFAHKWYGVDPNEQSEDAFFLYILPRVVVLHGYGDPLLDPHIPDHVGILTRAGIPTYFSCNPANIQMERTRRAFENGLTYIKYSIDSLSSSVRGKDAFEKDYPQIMKVLDMKEQKSLDTRVIITMIDLGRDEYDALKEAFKGTDVYIYQKSLDQAWMTGGKKPGSIHWSEFCQIPWSSMTINSSGLAVACEEDYQGEIVLGDAKTQSLAEIWNGEAYAKFRRSHFDLPTELKCTSRCDMRPIGKFIEKG